MNTYQNKLSVFTCAQPATKVAVFTMGDGDFVNSFSIVDESLIYRQEREWKPGQLER